MLKATLKTTKITSIRFLTALFTTIMVAEPGEAAVLSSNQQVQQVVDWFTGFFTNSTQVANDKTIPFITMENCTALALGKDNSKAKYVHLEQYFGGVDLLRTAAYEFSPSDSGVNLSVFSYLDNNMALGSCDNNTPAIDLSNLVSVSCDLTLVYEPNKFFGTNESIGCPTSFPEPGSIVVSTVTITPNTIDSLDQFITPDGDLLGTPIAFERVTTTPEPMPTLTLMGIGLVGLVVFPKGKHLE